MNDREKWRERVWNIRTYSTTWWSYTFKKQFLIRLLVKSISTCNKKPSVVEEWPKDFGKLTHAVDHFCFVTWEGLHLTTHVSVEGVLEMANNKHAQQNIKNICFISQYKIKYISQLIFCPVDWGCRINWLHLCRGVRPPSPNECPGYNAKQSDGEVPVMLGPWGMQSTPSLPLLPGPLWPGMVAPHRALSIG